jgi:hypothetical protein
MTEAQQLLEIEKMCNARAETVVGTLSEIFPGMQKVSPEGRDAVKFIIVSTFLPAMLHLGPQKLSTTGLGCDMRAIREFVMSVFSVPEEMIPVSLREMAQHLLPEISKQ